MEALITDADAVDAYLAAYAWIKAHPEQHRQDSWAIQMEGEPQGTDCGTGMCYAGTTAMLAGARFEFGYSYTTSRCIDAMGYPHDIGTFAAAQLGFHTGAAIDALEYTLFAAANDMDDIRAWIFVIIGIDPEGEDGWAPSRTWMATNSGMINEMATALVMQDASS